MYAFVLVGVSGSRISSVGVHIAARLSWPYLEEDDFHPTANLRKMYDGIVLSDTERAPAIDALARTINSQIQPCVMVACSMLTRCLRQRLEAAVQREVRFIYLRALPGMLAAELSDTDQLEDAPWKARATNGVSPGDAVEVDANGGVDVVAARVISRVRALAGMYRV